ncbi:trypsin-like serine protease [Shewanella xiamenensis]|uniref:trypsin-like serine protease n=1 Tax=Shewanella xiamenensis TaxID=332186 RepID=UPI002E7C56B4|nr:trypsin-like serine protease [Shewanella xiamenensis]MEE1981511.1 trypsin-like serine protease [Shewanella xiamenensis]
MKKCLIALALISAVSTPALAIQDGITLPWSEHDDHVKMNCSGTILAGKWVLTAGHCDKNSSLGVTTVNGLINVESVINNTSTDYALDIGLWKLTTPANTKNITFLSSRNIKEGERIRISGFGAGVGTQALAYAEQISIPPTEGRPEWITLKMDGKGNTVGGDSGSPYTDNNGLIIGVHTSGGIDAETGINAKGARLQYAKSWILETVNGWHFPTLASTPTSGGSVTIEVQSLYADAFIDNASASGDATITGGTCSGATIQPYDICTYTVSSNGYEGTVTLDGDQKITINKGRTKPVTPTPEPETGSGGGGSLGFLSLVCVFGIASLRRKGV